MSGPSEPTSRTGGRKLAQQVAEAVEAEIVQAGWPIGEVLGSEPDLLARFGVSRAVLREAVRILENHGVAEMRKGRGGGLTVRRPEVDVLARAAALQLDYLGATQDHLVDARLALELAALDLVVDNLDEGGRVALRTHMEHEQAILASTGLASQAHTFHRLLAQLSHNPVLAMCTEMLLGLQVERQRAVWADEAVPGAIAERSVQAHQDIVDALLAGDIERSRAAMRAHLCGLSHGRTGSICQRLPTPQLGQSTL